VIQCSLARKDKSIPTSSVARQANRRTTHGPYESHTKNVSSAAFSPDGKRIVTASDDETARLWVIFANTQELVSHVKGVTPRCLTPAQRSAFFRTARMVHRSAEMALPH
jgi:WD40 repeat protein